METTVRIPLSKGREALIDAADLELVSQFKWYAEPLANTCYGANKNSGKSKQYLHRHIMGETDPTVLIDHRNGDGLDNRRLNLRRSTKKQNVQNSAGQVNTSSGYKGVSYVKKSGKWRAYIVPHKPAQISLGTYELEEDAARAYDVAAKQYFGEFAYLNFK